MYSVTIRRISGIFSVREASGPVPGRTPGPEIFCRRGGSRFETPERLVGDAWDSGPVDYF